MRLGFINEPNHKLKLQYPQTLSPAKNFFYQNAGSSLIKSLISTTEQPLVKSGNSQHNSSKSPTIKHSPYQKTLLPSSVTKLRQSQTDVKQQQKMYITSNNFQSLQKKSSTPTLYTIDDDSKKKEQHRRQISKVVTNEIQSRPDSALSKKFTEMIPQSQSQVSTSAQSLIQKIRDQQLQKPIPQQSQLLQYHQELIDKQYKKLIDLQQQHYNTFKQTNPTETKGSQIVNGPLLKSAQKPQQISAQLGLYLANQTAKKLKGQRSISTPDIGSQFSKRLSYLNRTFVVTQPGITHTKQTKTNQDSYFIKQNLLGKPNCWILQVSDGHGTNGHFVAQFVKEKLPQQIENQLKLKKIPTTDFSSNETNILVTNALKQSFERTTRDLYSSGIDITFSGATTVTVVVLENEIWCANIGDSRAIVARELGLKEYQVVELSNDHKPDLPLELKRVVASGGRVQSYSDQDGNPVGPARVWIKEEDIPGLAMSRSFGDYVASQVGVISTPEIIKHTLRPQDKFMVIASDGIWEFLSNEWIINTVSQYYQNKDIEGACQKLVQEATLAWEREDEVVDDITCLIAFIGNDNTLEINQVQQKF